MNKYYIFLSLILLTSCFTDQLNDKIEGVWVLEKEGSKEHIYDSIPKSVGYSPMFYDFKGNDSVFFSHCGYTDTLLKWSLTSDSVLRIGSAEMKLVQLDDSLLIFKLTSEIYRKLYRPKELKLDKTESEISQILQTNRWYSNDTFISSKPDYIEYLNKQHKISKFRVKEPYFVDSTNYYQLEAYGIAVYNDYHFLYRIFPWIFNFENVNSIYQITSISDSSYTIFNPYLNHNYQEFNALVTEQLNKSHLIEGKWISFNSKQKSYGVNKRLANGILQLDKLYEGDLALNITDSILCLQIEELKPRCYEWQLNRSSNILLYKESIEHPSKYKSMPSIVEILQLTDTTMTLRLRDNRYYKRQEYPRQYVLNLIQEFKRNE